MHLSSIARAARRVSGRAAAAGTFLAAAALAGACKNDVNITNPNQPTSATFFKTADDANAGLVATYSALVRLGTFQRWQSFTFDGRSDAGTSFSPWSDLQNYNKFTQPNYNFDAPRDHWSDNYILINRANQVINQVPAIQMDPTQRSTIVAEAKFLRGLAYFRLISIFGGAPPVITTVLTAADRPASTDSAAIYAQIEQDFTDAASVLPKTPFASTSGHAVAGSAQAMLGKTLLQERKWAAAATALQPIVTGQYGAYTLVTTPLATGTSAYGSLFRMEGNNNAESLFEVQMGNPTSASGQGVGGLNMAKMGGPCGPTYCDSRPTKWLESQYLIDSTVDGAVDPRLDATLFRYRGDTTMVFGQTWKQRYTNAAGVTDTATVYWRKYSEYYTGQTDENWDVPIGYKVIRYADVLLMYAEALNEQGQPAAAAPYVNQVRARVNLMPISASLPQAQMRAAIMKERLLEFGYEQQRWLDLGRQGWLRDSVAVLTAHDSDFQFFKPGVSVVVPVPQDEIGNNKNIRQNPGY